MERRLPSMLHTPRSPRRRELLLPRVPPRRTSVHLRSGRGLEPRPTILPTAVRGLRRLVIPERRGAGRSAVAERSSWRRGVIRRSGVLRGTRPRDAGEVEGRAFKRGLGARDGWALAVVEGGCAGVISVADLVFLVTPSLVLVCTHGFLRECFEDVGFLVGRLAVDPGLEVHCEAEGETGRSVGSGPNHGILTSHFALDGRVRVEEVRVVERREAVICHGLRVDVLVLPRVHDLLDGVRDDQGGDVAGGLVQDELEVILRQERVGRVRSAGVGELPWSQNQSARRVKVV